MTFAEIVPLADRSGLSGGWWIVMCVVMLVCMGAMMVGMAGMGRGSHRGSSRPWERFGTRESPAETLERRFAEGEMSIEEYEARRTALGNGAAHEGDDRDEELPSAPGARQGRP